MGKWNFSLFHLLVQVYRDLYPQVLLNGEIILSLTKTSPTDVCIRLIRTELQISLIFSMEKMDLQCPEGVSFLRNLKLSFWKIPNFILNGTKFYASQS